MGELIQLISTSLRHWAVLSNFSDNPIGYLQLIKDKVDEVRDNCIDSHKMYNLIGKIAVKCKFLEGNS